MVVLDSKSYDLRHEARDNMYTMYRRKGDSMIAISTSNYKMIDPGPEKKCTEDYQEADYFVVDELIAPVISVLNQKGYKTDWSCSTHFTDDDEDANAYIKFAPWVRLPSIPDGWKYIPESNIIRWYPNYKPMYHHKTIRDYYRNLRYIIMWMEELLEWALDLDLCRMYNVDKEKKEIYTSIKKNLRSKLIKGLAEHDEYSMKNTDEFFVLRGIPKLLYHTISNYFADYMPFETRKVIDAAIDEIVKGVFEKHENFTEDDVIGIVLYLYDKRDDIK